MHIAPYDNQNKPIVDAENACVPLNYFNIVKLKKGEAFEYQVPGYETCIVPATGSVDVSVEGVAFAKLGNRGVDVWDGEPEGVYVPVGAKVTIVCVSDADRDLHRRRQIRQGARALRRARRRA
jgi:5-deoxy-glucuronate isomerase